MNYLLFNPFADNNHGEEDAKKVLEILPKEFEKIELVSLDKLALDEFLKKLSIEDKVILFGGDGTINNFANKVYGKSLPCQFYLHRAGTGNDFANDLVDKFNGELLPLNEYLKKLPKVIINGKETRFINGIGYGIDGMTCVVAEELKAKGAKKIDYASITVKLLLFKYKCPNATVTVDGVTTKFKKVWLASSMIGQYYGGGMQIAPGQDRLSNTLSAVILSGKGRIKTLMVFPKIFKGEHIKNKMTKVIKGKTITVSFDRPTALQIDGEVVKDVLTYTATIE